MLRSGMDGGRTLGPFPSPLSCLLLKVGRIVAFSCVPTGLFRLPWMARVKLNGSQNKTKTQRKSTGRVWRWSVSRDGRKKREGRATRVHLKHAWSCLKNILMTIFNLSLKMSFSKSVENLEHMSVTARNGNRYHTIWCFLRAISTEKPQLFGSCSKDLKHIWEEAFENVGHNPNTQHATG